jgi:hypothetical protein
MASVEIEKKNLSSMFPKWFKPIPGFKFRDQSGAPRIVIGWGGWRETEATPFDTPFGKLIGNVVKFNPCALLVAWSYKGEWFLSELSPERISDMGKLQKGWTEEQERELSGWK